MRLRRRERVRHVNPRTARVPPGRLPNGCSSSGATVCTSCGWQTTSRRLRAVFLSDFMIPGGSDNERGLAWRRWDLRETACGHVEVAAQA